MTPEKVFKKIARDFTDLVPTEVFHHCGEQTGKYEEYCIRITVPYKITWLTVAILLHELGHVLCDNEWVNLLIILERCFGRYNKKGVAYKIDEGTATALAGALAIKYSIYKKVSRYINQMETGL